MFSHLVYRNLILGFLIGTLATCPSLAEPPSEDLRQREQDLEGFRAWEDHFAVLPDDAAIARLEAWVEKHPTDVESVLILNDLYQLPFHKKSSDERWRLISRLEGLDSVPAKRAVGFSLALGFKGADHVQDGVNMLLAAVDAKDARACSCMGLLWGQGLGGFHKNYPMAEKAFMQAIGLGDKRAYGLLAGTAAANPAAKDEDVITYMKVGASEGDPQLQTELGKWYMQWATTDSTRKKSVQSLERAAKWGWPEAQNLLAECLATGKGVEIDRAAALKWYQSAAERHHSPAELELAEAYFGANEHLTVTPNDEEGMRWLTRAADDGDAYAQFILGARSLAEASPDHNLEKTRSLLLVAAKNGSAGAAITLKSLGQSITPEKRQEK